MTIQVFEDKQYDSVMVFLLVVFLYLIFATFIKSVQKFLLDTVQIAKLTSRDQNSRIAVLSEYKQSVQTVNQPCNIHVTSVMTSH